MNRTTEVCKSLFDERGATMVEYGFLIGGIATVVALAVGPFGQRVVALFQTGLDAFP